MKPRSGFAFGLALVLLGCRATPEPGLDAPRIRELEEENAKLRDVVASLQTRLELLATKTGVYISICPTYPPIDAVVLSVDGAVVVLDKGEQAEVRVGYVFDVYNGPTYKGQVRIQDVQATTSTGTLLGGKKLIVAGDSATTQL